MSGYKVLAGQTYTFKIGGTIMEERVISVDEVLEDGVLFIGITTSKFFMWFADSNPSTTVLTDTQFGLGCGINKIYL